MKRVLILLALMGIGANLFVNVALAQIEVQPLPVRAWPPREGDYIQTSIHPIDDAAKPAKLAYLTGKNSYVSIYKFQVEPGERYTIRAEYIERCKVRVYDGELRCWVFGSTEKPGVKILPINYDLTVEYSPCR